MIINISDDFDLKKIENSGQCFRVVELAKNPGIFRFIVGKDVLYIKKSADKCYDIDCDEKTWNSLWAEYFNLNTDYKAIRTTVCDDSFMEKACEYGKGIRLLKQPHFETLISFIISQRKNIPSIKKSIEKICLNYGDKIETNYETLYTFPEAEILAQASTKTLNSCSLGYRTPYVIDAAKIVSNDITFLDNLNNLDDIKLIETLKTIKGVGDKVANCVGLFSYGRTGLAPVDVWIKRLIDNEYGGINPFDKYGNTAGIMQQYAFYYMTNS